MKKSAQMYIAWLGRRNPLLDDYLAKLFPLNMTPDQLQINLVFREVSSIIDKKLLDFIKSTKREISIEETRQALEKIREDDFTLYKNGEKSLFHSLFHPQKKID